jgi:hypothetical protein
MKTLQILCSHRHCPTNIPQLNCSKSDVSLMLRPTVSRPVCLGIKRPSEGYDQIVIIAWQLLVCWYGAFSLTRGRACRLHLLLDLASAVNKLPFSLPPTIRRVTVEVFDPASTREKWVLYSSCLPNWHNWSVIYLEDNSSAQTTQKTVLLL